MNRVRVEFDEFKCNYKVLINGLDVGDNSPIQRYDHEPFDKWCCELIELIKLEINDTFFIDFAGPRFCGFILSELSAEETLCLGFKQEPDVYPIEQRLEWLADVLSRIGEKVSIQRPICRVSAAYDISNLFNDGNFTVEANGISFPEKAQMRQVRSRIVKDNIHADVWIGTDEERATDAELIYCVSENKPKLRDIKDGRYIIEGALSYCPEVVGAWIENALYPEWLVSLSMELLKKIENNAPFELSAKTRMIARKKPCLRIHIPERVEIGTRKQYSIEMFPIGRIELCESDPSVFSIDEHYISGKKEGKAETIIKYAGREVIRIPIEIYCVVRVQGIRLSVPHLPICVGDDFSIKVDYQPLNSENLDEAKWVVNNPAIFRLNKNGTFTAIGEGKCCIKHRVGNVEEEIVLEALPVAAGINLTFQRADIRVNDATQCLKYKVIPQNGVFDKVKVAVVDSTVLKYDENTTLISPQKEGSTDILFQLIGRNGQIISTEKCTVDVLPIHDIVTPEWPGIICVIGIVAALLMMRNQLWIVPIICAITSGGYWVFESRKRKKELIISITFVVIAVLLAIILLLI